MRCVSRYGGGGGVGVGVGVGSGVGDGVGSGVGIGLGSNARFAAGEPDGVVLPPVARNADSTAIDMTGAAIRTTSPAMTRGCISSLMRRTGAQLVMPCDLIDSAEAT